jgi:ElaB/YqjD/DUF883 family membrane-anchored ribosome-binding protein
MEITMSHTEMNRTIKQVGKDAHDTVDSATNAAEGMAQRVGDAAETVRQTADSVRQTARKVYDTTGDLGQQALERGTRYGSTVMEQVETRPMTAVLVASAVAFFAGLLFSRR